MTESGAPTSQIRLQCSYRSCHCPLRPPPLPAPFFTLTTNDIVEVLRSVKHEESATNDSLCLPAFLGPSLPQPGSSRHGQVYTVCPGGRTLLIGICFVTSQEHTPISFPLNGRKNALDEFEPDMGFIGVLAFTETSVLWECLSSAGWNELRLTSPIQAYQFEEVPGPDEQKRKEERRKNLIVSSVELIARALEKVPVARNGEPTGRNERKRRNRVDWKTTEIYTLNGSSRGREPAPLPHGGSPTPIDWTNLTDSFIDGHLERRRMSPSALPYGRIGSQSSYRDGPTVEAKSTAVPGRNISC